MDLDTIKARNEAFVQGYKDGRIGLTTQDVPVEVQAAIRLFPADYKTGYEQGMAAARRAKDVQ